MNTRMTGLYMLIFGQVPTQGLGIRAKLKRSMQSRKVKPGDIFVGVASRYCDSEACRLKAMKGEKTLRLTVHGVFENEVVYTVEVLAQGSGRQIGWVPYNNQMGGDLTWLLGEIDAGHLTRF